MSYTLRVNLRKVIQRSLDISLVGVVGLTSAIIASASSAAAGTPNSVISNIDSIQSNKLIDGNKPKAKITFGPYFPKKRTQEAQTISKTTSVIKKESYTGESFANRVPCYLCGGSGGNESGCLKCGGLGWVMEIDNPTV